MAAYRVWEMRSYDSWAQSKRQIIFTQALRNDDMIFPFLLIAIGLILLVWSADWFVEGSAAIAGHMGISPLLIGMLIVGFGTSAPELLVSSFSAFQGNPGIALGNAYGSNICNIALILGITAMIKPIDVKSQLLKKELPLLTLFTLIAIFQAFDGFLSRFDAVCLLIGFVSLILWGLYQEKKANKDFLGIEVAERMEKKTQPMKPALIKAGTGFFVLIASSRLLVSNAVQIASSMGVSDLTIGLTIVAVGTSLPELAASIMATRRNEHDIAIGNVVGSNLFNTLAVVGIAGMIHPMPIDSLTLNRDLMVVLSLTLLLFLFGYGFFKRPGRINRYEGTALLLCYVSYMVWVASDLH